MVGIGYGRRRTGRHCLAFSVSWCRQCHGHAPSASVWNEAHWRALRLLSWLRGYNAVSLSMTCFWRESATHLARWLELHGNGEDGVGAGGLAVELVLPYDTVGLALEPAWVWVVTVSSNGTGTRIKHASF